jgi:hypothetical protein
MAPQSIPPNDLTRRALLGRGAHGIGSIALASLLPACATPIAAVTKRATAPTSGPLGVPGLPHFAPRAKRVLCLFQSGGMSHIDLFDQKPRCSSTRARNCRRRCAARSASRA